MPEPQKNFAPKKAPEAPRLETAAAAFTVKEARLIVPLGTSRDILRELRAQHLTEGLDWQKAHRAVYLTEAAVEKIRQALALTPAEAPTPAPIETRLLTFPGYTPANLVVKAWRFFPMLRNKVILEAYFPHTDPAQRRNIVRVRVKDSAMFVQHMELPVKLVQPPDLYECTRPGPRSKGRW